MKKRRLLWQLYPSYLIIIALSFVVSTWSARSALYALHDAYNFPDLDDALRRAYQHLALAGLAVAACAAFVSRVVARNVSGPLEAIKQGAERFAKGELKSRLYVSHLDEVGELAQSLNRVAVQLEERVRTAVGQRNELEAVLSSMTEGILVLDDEQRVVRVNDAASRLLGASSETSTGRSVQEVVRNIQLQELIAATIREGADRSAEISMHIDGERIVHTYTRILTDAEERHTGMLVVLHDVTHVRRLENVRKDFVANVSHELKTPITSIKGFVETLLEGAAENPEDRQRFLQIIARQSERLNLIVEDLLTLAKIEQGQDRSEVSVSEVVLRRVLEAVLKDNERTAQAKNLSLSMNCSEHLRVSINESLFQQAVNNLVDNAVKHTDGGGQIGIEVQQGEKEILVSVRDTGSGIEKIHLPRLFERFYRVDKSRSRALGGTGLGLAIVKHIVQVHGGSITVESTPGQGSCFSIHLPTA